MPNSLQSTRRVADGEELDKLVRHCNDMKALKIAMSNASSFKNTTAGSRHLSLMDAGANLNSTNPRFRRRLAFSDCLNAHRIESR